jgi:acetylornithine deacetylase
MLAAVSTAAERHLGRAPERRGEPWWTDCALLADAGIETVMIGPSGAGAHAADEWVDVGSVLTLTDILADSIVAICA